MIYIYSAGGYAREFARCIKIQYGDDLQFVDDVPSIGAIQFEQVVQNDPGRDGKFVVGFANSSLRQKKTEEVIDSGFSLLNVIAPTAVIGENVEIGTGCIFSDFAIVTADAHIGNSFQCNIYSYVAHDCIIGNYVTLAPRVNINGRVCIKDSVYIGTGATILPGKPGKPITIGEGATIGAHALVTKDVAPFSTVVGIPARPLVKE